MATTFPRRHRPQLVACPICGGKLSPHLLSWHLDRWHDEGPAAALDPDPPVSDFR